MKLSEEQMENMEWEDIEKIIKDAIESRDMEFITSTLLYVDDYFNLDGDYFVSNFDNDLFKDRDMALLLAKLGQQVPKDLYENDEEMILASVSAPGRWDNGFLLASDKYISDKEFVKKMFAEIDDYEYLSELLGEYSSFGFLDSLLPEQVLEDGEIEQFIRNRIEELEEQAKQDKVYEGMSELAERRMDYYGEYSSQRKFYPSFLDFLKEKELSADGTEKSVIQDLIRSEEKDKEQSEAPSELEQLASTKKELEQIVSELRENIASAQKLLASYEELLNGGKQNDSNEGQTFGEE